jgi:hypothetical protein
MQRAMMYGCLAALYGMFAGQSLAEDVEVCADVGGTGLGAVARTSGTAALGGDGSRGSAVPGRGPAEVVSVRYGDEIDLAPFRCSDVKGRRVSRACYDAANRYLLIRVEQSYRQFCDVDAAITDRFLSSPAMDRFFESIIEDRHECRAGNMPKYEPVPQAVSIDLTQ